MTDKRILKNRLAKAVMGTLLRFAAMALAWHSYGVEALIIVWLVLSSSDIMASLRAESVADKRILEAVQQLVGSVSVKGDTDE